MDQIFRLGSQIGAVLEFCLMAVELSECRVAHDYQNALTILHGAESLAKMVGSRNGRVAQLVEQGIENPRVGGSIPSPATITWND